MKIQTLTLIALGALALAPSALAGGHAGDIGLVVVNNAIQTVEMDTAGAGPVRRVFEGAFGSEGEPSFTSEPGFDAEPGTFLPGTRVGFRFTAPLLRWNGEAFVPTAEAGPLAGDRVSASFLSLSATTDSGPAPGFDLAVQVNGGWHRHLTWQLLPAPDAAVPSAGAYLIQMEMYSTDPAVMASLPFGLVLGNEVEAEVLDAAVEAAEALLATAQCPADLTADGVINGADLGMLLSAWGQGGPADLNGDGIVNGADLGTLLSAWGACPR